MSDVFNLGSCFLEAPSTAGLSAPWIEAESCICILVRGVLNYRMCCTTVCVARPSHSRWVPLRRSGKEPRKEHTESVQIDPVHERYTYCTIRRAMRAVRR